jgi:hypothetical protein
MEEYMNTKGWMEYAWGWRGKALKPQKNEEGWINDPRFLQKKKKKKSYHYSGDTHASRTKYRVVLQERLRNGCAICGVDHQACLEFHHRVPEQKRFNIATFVASEKWTPTGKEKLEEELRKCEVLCTLCHRRLHYLGSKGIKSKFKKGWWDVIHLSTTCTNCHHSFDVLDLDFHHPDPNAKECNVSKLLCLSPLPPEKYARMRGSTKDARRERNIEAVASEATKCLILCANCHRRIHWEIATDSEGSSFRGEGRTKDFPLMTS